MPVPPQSVKTSVNGHLDFHASRRWPQLEEITVSWRGSFGYVTGHLPGDEELPLCRLRYLGLADHWGFALYRHRRLRGLDPANRNPDRHI